MPSYVLPVMIWRLRLRIVPMVLVIVGGLLGQAAGAQEGLASRSALDGGPSASAPDRSFLDGLAKDLNLSLLTTPGQSTVRLPLAPGNWSFFKSIEPYAALSPSTVKPITEAEPSLAALSRETPEDPWKGLGVGAGLKWRLSDRVDLFGQYQFMSLPGGNAPTGSPLMRRETEHPGVKAGLSIHF
jgi:hypothetical protein